MFRNIIFWSAVLVSLAGWPLSLTTHPPKLETGFIWQMDAAAEEKRILLQKLGMSVSPLKRIFYNKTTILVDRYTKNILRIMDPGNYFFGDRIKFPSAAIFGFLTGTYLSIKKKKYYKLWWYGLMVALIVAFFKKTEGWDFLMFPLVGYISYIGTKEINKYKFGWVLLLIVAILELVQVGRMPL